MSQKRKDVAEGELRPLCKYGKDCYRKNPDHLKTFSHPQGRYTTARGNTSNQGFLPRLACTPGGTVEGGGRGGGGVDGGGREGESTHNIFRWECAARS